ncbi:putative metallopeptidase-like protein [Chromohalobacter marismortui]|uniref:Putative metallopeptidase-like protein n=1 Tax=Chromohalobacter marismortui TaxID=42055 RepID=A0A4V3F3P9_9GAMM|nr:MULTISPECIES: hypothetical protein [Chromohalobacter]MCI0511535.1 hypothetical protein [Chromohalobacter sp.]MCI0594460.1 hypothetical protein [Chromohalobacter sp.]TDU20476.1 putative metallopeptidase-like protein [Chromohalobacter marismortui]
MSKGVVTPLASYAARQQANTVRLKEEQLASWVADREHWHDSCPLNADLADSLTLVPVIDDRVVTATTDGRCIYFDARFSATLEAAHRRYLQAHLVWHCALGYLLPPPSSRTMWHLAWDHEINSLLLQQGYMLPTSAVLFFSKIPHPAHEVHDWLLTHPALEQEATTDRLHAECRVHAPTSRTRLDPDFTPTPPDSRLIETWRSHTRMLALDYQWTHHLPLPIATRMKHLASFNMAD